MREERRGCGAPSLDLLWRAERTPGSCAIASAPLLVLAYTDDGVTTPGPAIRLARLAGADLVELPGGHYEGYLHGHEEAVRTQLAFLRRTLLDRAAPARMESDVVPS